MFLGFNLNLVLVVSVKMSIASLENHYINLLTPLSAGVDISDSCLFLLIGLLGEVPMMKSESSFCFNKAILLSILSSRHFNWKKNTHHIFHSYEFFLQWLTDLSINELDLLYTFPKDYIILYALGHILMKFC